MNIVLSKISKENHPRLVAWLNKQQKEGKTISLDELQEYIEKLEREGKQ